IDDSKVDGLMSKYAVFNMKTSDIIRDYNGVQQLKRQAKKIDAADSTMDKKDARREVFGQNPQLAQAARETQLLVGEVQSATLARAVTSERQLDEVMV